MPRGLGCRAVAHQPPLRQRPGPFVNTRPPQSALREMRQHLTRPTTLGVLVGVALLAALVGPFDTADLLRPVPRFGYWLVMAGATYAAGYLAAELALRHRAARRMPRARPALAVLATALAVPPTVLAVNYATLGAVPSTAELPGFLGTLFAIAAVVAGLLHLAFGPPAKSPAVGPEASVTAPEASAAAPPPILDRMPLDRRGPLVALSVEDHYVRIRTTRGEALVLMRLGDAMREVGAVEGVQVHRSHWVALGQVRAARREGDRAMLTMAAGPEIPVSRSNVPALRAAGLLPR